MKTEDQLKLSPEYLLFKQVMNGLNGSFNYRNFAECIGYEHPTLQQCLFRLMQKCALHMASGAIRIDDRNRASYTFCCEIAKILEKQALPLI